MNIAHCYPAVGVSVSCVERTRPFYKKKRDKERNKNTCDDRGGGIYYAEVETLKT